MLKGEYALGSYLHALKEARAFLRAKMLEVCPKELKTTQRLLKGW